MATRNSARKSPKAPRTDSNVAAAPVIGPGDDESYHERLGELTQTAISRLGAARDIVQILSDRGDASAC